MTEQDSRDIAQKLAQLRADYARRLPEQLQAIKALGQALTDPEHTQSALAQLHQRLHKLAGSAGSFGFAELGQQARQLERQAQHWLDAGQWSAGSLKVFAVALATLANSASRPDANEPACANGIVPSAANIVLLTESEALAEEIRATLSHFGHRVTHLASWAVLEQQFLALAPDILIADLPDAGAEPLASRLSQQQALLPVPVPVVFLAEHAEFADYLAAVRAGAVAYLAKPLDIHRLLDCLEVYLRDQRTEPYRVLIVDDDRDLAEHYQLVLRAAGMQVEVQLQPEQVLQSLQDCMPEMILLDLHMPDCSGQELARVIRLNDQWLRVPIAYLSAETDPEVRIRAMGQAGDEFLSKPISDRELVAAVRVRAARSRQLSDAIDRDSLTGLLKHSRIKEAVSAELARARRSGQPLCVAMIDLDHFKQVNDHYGHGAGDKVIRALAQLLRLRLRKTDSIGRYGGEEFVAVLPLCEAAAAEQLLNEVREAFARVNFQAEGQAFNVTFSAGLLALKGASLTPEAALKQVDEALYQAKREGRNRVCRLGPGA